MTMKNCEHVMEVIKEKDDNMLPGYSIFEKCRKCGSQLVPMGVNIGFYLELLAQELGITYQDLTPSLLAKASTLVFPFKVGKQDTKYLCFFPKELQIEQAKILLDNPDKGILLGEL